VNRKNLDRRDFSRLTAAALGGAVAGASLGLPAVAAEKDDKKKKKKEAHVCRGLNECKSQGATGKNACRGQGACATAKHHVCAGMNACKGQGGCGATAGKNACKGKGKCAVPLMDKKWKQVRMAMEAKWKKAGKEFGDPPPKPKKKAGK